MWERDIWLEIEYFGQSWPFEGKQKRDYLLEICKEALGEYVAFKENECGRGGGLLSNNRDSRRNWALKFGKVDVQKGFLGRNRGFELKWGFQGKLFGKGTFGLK